MKFGRVLLEGREKNAFFEGDKAIVDGRKIAPGKFSFLPPCIPQKIVCLGKNYSEHARELKSYKMIADSPDKPTIFLKPPSAMVGSRQPIVWPEDKDVERVDYEGEMAVVIREKAKNVSVEDAHKYVAGYTCFNDVTARNVQKADVQWTRAKSYDSFAPIGPWITDASEFNPLDARVTSMVNGETKQDSNTSKMTFNAFEIVAWVSRIMTLFPGDVIATGTPEGVGPLKRGDEVEVEIEGIGILKNKLE
ncbi:fumarylacetoacetate hydrolase family protein [Candidatus Micrarchaeota archaeon]|nr:fumarylacetoacetate hydrolase family protein [Candidatus Micrarchaeota archaeon]